MNVYPFIEAERAGRRNVKRACAQLEVSRAAFYAWLQAIPSKRCRANARLLEKIRSAHRDSKGIRISACARTAEKERRGMRQEPHRPAHAGKRHRGQGPPALQADHDPRSRSKRGRSREARLRARHHRGQPAVVRRHLLHPHVGGMALSRDSDRCRVPAGGGMGDGRSHAHRARRRCPADDARPSPAGSGLIFHSDRGCQYTSDEFAALLDRNGIVQSLSRPGQCWDNAVAESFFATLKTELIHDHAWPTRAFARRAIFEFIEGWYNRHRLHSSLGYMSPADYERSCAIPDFTTEEAA